MWRLFTGIVPLVIVTIFCIISISNCVSSKIEWDNEIGYAWEMADRSSTLAEKSKYMNEFIIKLKDSEHAQYGALVYKTREKSFDLNMKALETLGKRLREVQNLDIESFAYQTAIQQITAQEQGEAQNMIGILRTAWDIENFWWGTGMVIVWVWIIWTVLLIWFFVSLFWWHETKY